MVIERDLEGSGFDLMALPSRHLPVATEQVCIVSPLRQLDLSAVFSFVFAHTVLHSLPSSRVYYISEGTPSNYDFVEYTHYRLLKSSGKNPGRLTYSPPLFRLNYSGSTLIIIKIKLSL